MRTVKVRPRLIAGQPAVIYDAWGNVIPYHVDGVNRPLDTHLSRAIKRGELEIVELKELKKVKEVSK